MNLNLRGQSVAVFGAANGIGKAIAEGFVAEGCAVRRFDRDAGADFVTGGGDATRLEQARNLIAYVVSNGQVDLPK